MKFKIKVILLTIVVFSKNIESHAQEREDSASNGGWVSIGGRTTLSLFDRDGIGLGTGGQFRIQMSNQVNTDWFADYITINVEDKVRSDYYHIGWSVLYYPFKNLQYPKKLQPYILAGHCFDYNKKTAIHDSTITESRWGSAVQAGLGTHFNLSEKFDISLTCQYMMHLTPEIEAEIDGESIELVKQKSNSLEGHLLTTVSINFKLFRLWKK